MYKYPYIPKEYYPAVMYACSLIRKYHTFNMAIKTAAKEYDVDEVTLEKHVRKRQGAGQKGTTRKYRYYVVEGYTDENVCYHDYSTLLSYEDKRKWEEERIKYVNVIKATCKANAEKKIPLGESYDDYYQEWHGKCVSHYSLTEYDSEEKANEHLNKLLATGEKYVTGYPR